MTLKNQIRNLQQENGTILMTRIMDSGEGNENDSLHLKTALLLHDV